VYVDSQVGVGDGEALGVTVVEEVTGEIGLGASEAPPQPASTGTTKAASMATSPRLMPTVISFSKRELTRLPAHQAWLHLDQHPTWLGRATM
jgi:hypothetical protein